MVNFAPDAHAKKRPFGALSVEICAALVLLCIALPLNVGVALASGVPPQSGIISGIIAAIVTGSLSGAPILISGPDAGIGVLVREMIQQHGASNLGVIVFLAGLIQLLIGVFRSSFWFKAVSPAVVNGMLGGMGLLIILSQVHIMLDDNPKETGLTNLLLLPETLSKIAFPADGTSHQMAAILGLATILIAAFWVRLAPVRLKQIPNVLVAIVAVSAMAWLLDLKVNFVSLPQSASAAISILSVDALVGAISNSELWTAAAMLAFVCSAQSLVTLSAVDTYSNRGHGTHNRELMAQGVGNLLCGLLGALPIAGVLLRSVANVQLGAKTRLPNLLHGVLMVTTVLCLPGILQSIPTSVLAATLVLIGFRMVTNIWQKVRKFESGELFVFSITAIVIVATNLFSGLIFGFIAAAIKQLHTLTRMDVVLETSDDESIATIHVKGAATFLRLPMLSGVIERLPTEALVHVNLCEVKYIDHACLKLFIDWEREHRGRLVIDWSECFVAIPVISRRENKWGTYAHDVFIPSQPSIPRPLGKRSSYRD